MSKEIGYFICMCDQSYYTTSGRIAYRTPKGFEGVRTHPRPALGLKPKRNIDEKVDQAEKEIGTGKSTSTNSQSS